MVRGAWRPVHMLQNPSEIIWTGRVLKTKIEARIYKIRLVGIWSPGASHSSHIRLRTCSQGDFLQRLTPATATSSAGSQPSALVVHGGGGPSTEAVPEVVPPARQPSLELHLLVQVGWFSSDGLKSLSGAIPRGGSGPLEESLPIRAMIASVADTHCSTNQISYSI